ncbi:Sensor histidine kinase LiaS [Pseudoclavibacter triregionum]|nr:Sensor histidine kinase LiaS [Pseudoclavibacter triregionum]
MNRAGLGRIREGGPYDRGMPTAPSPVGRAILVAAIALGALLLAPPIAQAALETPDRLPAVLTASGLELVALAGGLHPLLVRPEVIARPATQLRWQHALWLALLCLPWSWLIVLASDAGYLGMALYFLALWLLPPVSGTVAAFALAALTAAGLGVHHGWTTGAIVGPIGVAAVMVAVVVGYRSLIAESTARAELIAELEATQAQLAESERREGVLAERARLGRELHDTVAQHLSSIQLLLHAAESHGATPEGRERLAQARDAAAEALAETRAVVRDLSPRSLEGASLATALERLAERSRARTRLDVEVRADADARALPMAVEATLLRIAQEAMANLERHAGATRAELSLELEPDAVTLEISDDGRGFDAEAALASGPKDASGYGLAGMRARAAELGGYASIVTAPGEGTLVSVRIPLAAGPAAGGVDAEIPSDASAPDASDPGARA